MSSLAVVLQEDRRGLILCTLDEASGFRLSDVSIRTILDNFGHRVSTDQVRGDLHWLAEQGLVRVEKVETHWLAELLNAGQEVARGVSHPGVRKQAARR